MRSMFAAWERGDFSSAEWADPEIEFVIADGPEPATWIGVAGMSEGFRRRRDAFTGARVFADEYRELDADRVLVLTHVGGTGRTSGLGLDQIGAKTAQLLHIHGGMVTKFLVYWDRDRALADLGLEE